MLTFFPTALTDLFTHVVVYPSIIHLLCVEATPASTSFCDDLENETQPLTFRCYGQWGKHSDKETKIQSCGRSEGQRGGC